jgi:hypothetical protein
VLFRNISRQSSTKAKSKLPNLLQLATRPVWWYWHLQQTRPCTNRILHVTLRPFSNVIFARWSAFSTSSVL